jgi:hypothetical protein
MKSPSKNFESIYLIIQHNLGFLWLAEVDFRIQISTETWDTPEWFTISLQNFWKGKTI